MKLLKRTMLLILFLSIVMTIYAILDYVIMVRDKTRAGSACFFLFTVKFIKDCFPLIWVIFCTIQQDFTSYLQKHNEVLTELEKATRRLKKLEMVYKDFELQKVCYLPLNMFLLKPIQRLMHYKLILARLCKHYTAEHRDFADCQSEWASAQLYSCEAKTSCIENFASTLSVMTSITSTNSM